jgi:hypothetical protein
MSLAIFEENRGLAGRLGTPESGYNINIYNINITIFKEV